MTSGKGRSPARLAFILLSVCAGAPLPAAGSNPPVADSSPLRLALSEKVVRGVSLNDARAALSVWSEEIGRAAGLKLASQQNLILPSDQILAAIRKGTLDLFCLTVQEYRQVVPYVDTSRILGDDYGGDELVLVVRDGIGIANLAGLRGRSLIIFDSPNSTLAEPWLAVSLWHDGQDSPEQLLGHISHNSKLAQVVLPVFFGQADACVATRRGLNTMFELNPQLARKLKVLAASPRATGYSLPVEKTMRPIPGDRSWTVCSRYGRAPRLGRY